MVDVVRLDSVVHERIHLLKVDAQGFDDRVIMGAKGIIENYGIDAIHMEFSPVLNRKGGGRPEAILHWLYDYGYVCFDCDVFQPPPLGEERSFNGYADTFRVGSAMRGAGDDAAKARAGKAMPWTDIMCFH
jgi:hypothetical protein